MTSRHTWTAQRLETLRTMYPDNTAAEVATAIGCSTSTVYNKAASLGLKKSAAFLEGDRSGRILRGREDPRMTATQFRKGHVTWNKGVPGSTGTHENCRKTQFKKGRKPEESRNYQPIGSLRLSKDGYLEQKVTDDHPVPARRWVGVHRLVWEAANGPIPEGHIVAFIANRRTNVLEEITVDRLECISRAENARLNHPRSKSPELAKLTQLKGAITRQVNRIIRESQQ